MLIRSWLVCPQLIPTHPNTTAQITARKAFDVIASTPLIVLDVVSGHTNLVRPAANPGFATVLYKRPCQLSLSHLIRILVGTWYQVAICTGNIY